MDRNAKVELLSPVGEHEVASGSLAPGLTSLEGKVGGFIDNGKPPANVLLDALEGELSQRFGLRKAIRSLKRRASRPCPDLEELAGQVDFVVEGIAL